MSRHKRSDDVPVGQDSFLDVVSNLVGVIIILVLVVGARAKDAVLQVLPSMMLPAAATAGLTSADVVEAKTAEQNVEADIHRMSNQFREQDLELQYRQQERDRSQLLVTAAEQSLAEKRGQLDESQRAEFDRRSELAGAQSELEQLRAGLEFLRAAQPRTEILEHLPTPMAKTVFGKELHVRLREGRVTFVPWDEFVSLLKDDASKKVWRLKDQDEFTELIGPLGGFWMHYTLKRETHMLPTKAGVATQQAVVLDRFTITPETEGGGEPVRTALQAGSQFATRLANYRPESTTITAWTYPDSFNEFRELKRELFQRGFVTAARPLPADHPIGGSPDGTRSAAQ